MPCVVILIPKHSFCNTVCVCMFMQIKLVVVDHNHTCNLLNISALHVQYGIQAFAKFKRPECTRSHRRELQSQKFSRRSMRPKLPRKVRRSQSTLYYISLVYPFLPVRDISISGYRYRALWLVKIKTETKQIWPRATGDESRKWNKFLNSECIKNTTVESTFGRSFPKLQRRRPSFCCFTCSSDVPLQVTCGLMA